MNNFGAALRVYLVDDELLALKRLRKLLSSIEAVEVVGSTTAPETAASFLESENVDVLFLDIQMPGMNGFELLSKLRQQPLVIFTTAYDSYALKAFEVNSIDYLLKPIEPAQLERALKKVQQLRDTAKALETRAQLQSLMVELADKFPSATSETPNRISTRVGSRILFVDLDKITHFFSEDKLTFAATTETKRYIIDYTLAELEQKFEPKGFVRIHRQTLVNLSYVDELYRWFAGGMRIRIKDKSRTELTVSREQVKILKKRLGL
jgi:Response regulator of the LytR/AlgR family